MKALFDSNILIDYLLGREEAAAEFARHHEKLISVVTWMEILAGAKTAEHEDVVDMFLRDFRVIEITRLIARDAVALRRARKLRLPDAIIWASARAESALLVTRDTRAFPKDEPAVRVPY